MTPGEVQPAHWIRPLGLAAAVVLVTNGHRLTPLVRQVQHDILERSARHPLASSR